MLHQEKGMDRLLKEDGIVVCLSSTEGMNRNYINKWVYTNAYSVNSFCLLLTP